MKRFFVAMILLSINSTTVLAGNNVVIIPMPSNKAMTLVTATPPVDAANNAVSDDKDNKEDKSQQNQSGEVLLRQYESKVLNNCVSNSVAARRGTKPRYFIMEECKLKLGIK